MKTLFGRTFVVFFFSMTALLGIAAVLFFLGIQRSIAEWNIYRRHALQNLIVPHLNDVYTRDGKLTNHAVREALSDLLSANQYVYLLDHEYVPVFLYYAGDDMLADGGSAEQNLVDQLQQAPEMMQPVLGDEQPIGYLRANTLGFMNDIANRRFVRSIGRSLAVGLLVCFLLALLVAYLFSRHISVQMGAISSGLKSLSNGARDVRFPVRKSRELRDITRSAQSLQEQLLSEERLRRQWASDIAHDLRTPLAALKTQFEGLKNGYITISPKRLDALFSQLLLLERLVNDLSELNRIESPEMVPNNQQIDAVRFISGIARSFEAVSRRSRMELSTTCETEYFIADEMLMSRALGNVVQNAIQYAIPDSGVHIRLFPQGGNVVLDVSNPGHVDKADIPNFFNRLYRGDRTGRHDGSGLGLAITRAIAELHGGSVTMYQSLDRTHVEIRIPSRN